MCKSKIHVWRTGIKINKTSLQYKFYFDFENIFAKLHYKQTNFVMSSFCLLGQYHCVKKTQSVLAVASGIIEAYFLSTLAYTVVYSACKCTVCYRVNSVMMFPSQNLNQMILSGDIQNTNT